MNPRRRLSPSTLAGPSLAVLGLFISSPAFATTYYWDNTSGSNASGNNTNWATALDGLTDPASAPSSLNDDWYFNVTSLNTAQTIGLNGNRQALGLTFNSTGTTSIENNTTSGATNILALGSGGITVNSGAGAVSLNALFATRGSMVINLAANQSWANNSSNLFSNVAAVTNVGNVTPFTLTLNGSGTGGTTFSGAISDGGTTGTTSLKINTTGGTTTLAAANTYTGDTTLQAGALAISNASALQNSTVNMAGGTLSFGTLTTATFGGLKGSGDLTLTNTTPAAVTLTVGGSNADTSYSGALGGTGSLIKTGTGTLTLSGNNSYSGNTTVNGGTLLLDKSTGTGALGTAGTLSLTGGTFQVKGAAGGSSQTLGAIATLGQGSTNKIVVDSNGGSGTTLTFTSSAAPTSRSNGATLLIDLSSANSVLATTLGLVAGTQTNTQAILDYALVKDATGTGYATNVGGNIVRYTGAEALVDATAPTASANVKFNPTSGSTSITTSASPTINSLSIDTSGATGGVLNLSGTLGFINRNVVLMTGSNDFTIQGGTSFGSSGKDTVIHNAGTGTLTISSAILSSAVPVAKDGQGTVVLSGNSNFTNGLRINEGVLRLGAAGNGTNTPFGTSAGSVFVYRGGALDLGGNTLSVAKGLTLNGTGVSSGGALFNSGSAATWSGLVTLGSASTIVANNNITLSNVGTITGATLGLTLDGTATGSSIASIIGTTTGGVTKNGTGTWTLSGVNTYTGATTINAGTLALGASNVLATGTAVTLGGGKLNLGGFSQAAFTKALTMTASSTIDFGTHVTGLTLKFADSSAATWTGSLSLLNFTVGTDNLSFTSVTGLGVNQLNQITLAGYTATSLDASGNVQFTVSAVPEPSTVAFLGGIAALGFAGLRRRRR